MPAHTPVAPDKPEKEEREHSIQPCHRFNPRTVNFKIAAVRAGVQPNSIHENTATEKPLLGLMVEV
jgi:hypothetical protein